MDLLSCFCLLYEWQTWGHFHDVKKCREVVKMRWLSLAKPQGMLKQTWLWQGTANVPNIKMFRSLDLIEMRRFGRGLETQTWPYASVCSVGCGLSDSSGSHSVLHRDTSFFVWILSSTWKSDTYRFEGIVVSRWWTHSYTTSLRHRRALFYESVTPWDQ